MKKRLEAELISIAHRVLKLKNKSEVDQLFTETQKLYEALSVLKFYGDYIEHSEPEITQEELEEKLTDSLEGKKAPSLDKETKADIKKEEKQVVSVDEESNPSEHAEQSEPDAIVEETVEEELTEEQPIIVGEINLADEEDDDEEPIAEVKEASDSDPIFEMAAEAPAAEAAKNEPEKAHSKQISFEDFLGDSFKDVEFVKPNDTSKPTPKEEPAKEPVVEEPKKEPKVEEPTPSKEEKIKPATNEKSKAGINIGLNDRVGFVKYLFDDSSEDLNRVLSQLNTFDSFPEAKEFINDMVKPDYNNWKGKEDYEERFMEIVEQKFK